MKGRLSKIGKRFLKTTARDNRKEKLYLNITDNRDEKTQYYMLEEKITLPVQLKIKHRRQLK